MDTEVAPKFDRFHHMHLEHRMRLMVKFALIRGPVALQAAADAESPVGRWVAATLDLKTIIAVLAFAGALIASHVKTASDIAELREQNTTQAQLIEANTERTTRVNQRINTETVSKDTFTQTVAQIGRNLDLLSANQAMLVAAEARGAYFAPLPRSR